jgi:hypothetical protein
LQQLLKNAQHDDSGEINQEYIAESSTSNSVDRKSGRTLTKKEKMRIASESLWLKNNILLNERQRKDLANHSERAV